MRIFTWLARRRFPYAPLVTLSVSRSRLLHNIAEFQRLSGGMAIAPVLKSNAYGHGLIDVAGALAKVPGIPFFIVDSYFEAVALRAKHFKEPILIVGYTRPETIVDSGLKRCAFTVTSMETLVELAHALSCLPIHLKIDTGMRRQGILAEEVPDAIRILRENKHISLEGIATHLSDTDNADSSFTEDQILRWNAVVKQFKTVFPTLKYIHATATDGARFSKHVDGNVIRLGIGLYGLRDHAHAVPNVDLQPILEMKTILTGVKKLRAGETVGYGNTFKAEKDMTIATIPVGYYEGVDRRLSNKGSVQVGPVAVPCPIIGRVSMNITVIDVSAVPQAEIGTAVCVMSREEKDPNSIQAMARCAGTIAYEIAVHLPAHLKRTVIA